MSGSISIFGTIRKPAVTCLLIYAGRKKRKKRYGRPTTRGQLKNRASIDQRPPIVETRSRAGDWQVDTVIGQQGGAVVVTETKRKTRLTLLAWSKSWRL